MGSLIISLLRNHLWVRRWKKFENRSTFAEEWAIKYRVVFLWNTVYTRSTSYRAPLIRLRHIMTFHRWVLIAYWLTDLLFDWLSEWLLGSSTATPARCYSWDVYVCVCVCVFVGAQWRSGRPRSGGSSLCSRPVRRPSPSDHPARRRSESSYTAIPLAVVSNRRFENAVVLNFDLSVTKWGNKLHTRERGKPEVFPPHLKILASVVHLHWREWDVWWTDGQTDCAIP